MLNSGNTEQLQPILQLADSHRLLHQYRQAEKSYRQVLKYAPNHPQALQGLGQVFLDRKKPKKALEYFLSLTRYSPELLVGWLQVCQIYQSLGKTLSAQETLLQALEHHPQAGELHYALAQIYQAQNQADLALQALETAIRFQAPAEAYLALSQRYKTQGELLKSWELYEQAVALKPELGESLDDQTLEAAWQKLVQETAQSPEWAQVQALFQNQQAEGNQS